MGATVEKASTRWKWKVDIGQMIRIRMDSGGGVDVVRCILPKAAIPRDTVVNIRLEVPFADGLRSPRVPFASSPFPVAARLGALTKPLRGSRPRCPPGTVHLVEITFHYPFHIPSLSLLPPFKVHQEPNETSGNQPPILLSYRRCFAVRPSTGRPSFPLPASSFP